MTDLKTVYVKYPSGFTALGFIVDDDILLFGSEATRGHVRVFPWQPDLLSQYDYTIEDINGERLV